VAAKGSIASALGHFVGRITFFAYIYWPLVRYRPRSNKPQTLDSKIRKIKFDLSGYYFIGLVVLVLSGFWPTYFSKFFDKTADFTVYFHFHAIMLSLWILALIVQPILIRKKKLAGTG